jgi:hypothetical protein
VDVHVSELVSAYVHRMPAHVVASMSRSDAGQRYSLKWIYIYIYIYIYIMENDRNTGDCIR